MTNTWGGRALLIAEKPELGRAVAKAIIGQYREKDGVIDGGELCVCWAYGHLLSLAEPEEYDSVYQDRTDESLLPVFFDDWKRVAPQDVLGRNNKIVTDNKYKRDRLKQIGLLLKQYPTVIHCGDPDDEGQLLIDEILDYFNYDGRVLRVRINDNLPENIIRQFEKLEDNREYRAIGESAYARQMADKCFGVNYSRLASIRAKQFLAMGRVMNPTLDLVVTRDALIDGHVKQKYYDLVAQVNVNGTILPFGFKANEEFRSDGEHVLDKAFLQTVANQLNRSALKEIIVETKRKKVLPPLPYNATELQADMNGRYGYSLKETLQISQTLREKYQAITYNRSDCQYLGVEHHKEAPEVLNYVFENIGRSFPVDYGIMSKCFDDSKVSAHHGIIPQGTEVDLDKLTEKERNVYTAICERYIMQFLPPIQKDVCRAIKTLEVGVLTYHSEQIVYKGFLEFFDNKDRQEQPGVLLESGKHDGFVEDVSLEEKETRPPKRYTPRTLVKDMCGISKYVKDPEIKAALKDKDKGKEGEKGSIGTVATRGAVVDRLLTYGYLEMKGSQIVSTAKGRALSGATPEHAKKPDVTAKWWLLQERVKSGELGVNEIMHSVVEEFQKDLPTAFKERRFQEDMVKKEVYGKCPLCGGDVVKGLNKQKRYVWYCTNWKKRGCDFKMYEDAKHYKDDVRLTDKRVIKLLSGGTITVSLTSKNGTEYKGKLALKVNEYKGRHYANFELVGFPEKRKKSGSYGGNGQNRVR